MNVYHRTRFESFLRVVALVALTVGVVCYAGAVQMAGGSVSAFVLYLLLAIVLVILPGAALTHALLPDVSGAGQAACGFALGTGLLTLSAMACLNPDTLRILLFVPFMALLAIILFFFWAARKRGLRGFSAVKAALCKVGLLQGTSSLSLRPGRRGQAQTDSIPISLLLLCVAGGLFVYSFSGVLAFAHAGTAGNMVYHQDMMWSVGNSAAAQWGLPLRDIRAAGGYLRYHYLSDALPGFLALAGGLLPYDAACYYHYPLVLVFLVCAVYAAARAYGAHRRIAALLVCALLFLQGFGSPNTLELLRNMNGVPAAVLLACTLLFLIFSATTPDDAPAVRSTPGFYLVFACVCGVLLMSKNLYAILIVCGVLAAAVVGSITRRKLLTTPFCMAAVGIGMIALCWMLVFRYATNNLIQTFWISPAKVAASITTWLPLGTALYLISLLLSVRHFKKLSFARLVVNAAALGGVLAYFLFQHYSASQQYFLLAAFLFFWFCALDVAPYLSRYQSLQVLAGALAVVCLAGTTLTLLPVAQKGVQVALRCAGLRPAYPAVEETVTPGDEAAALWLREHMSHGDVFATNRNAKSAAAGEGTWHYYTAMSGRQAFVESWRYAMDYGYDYHALRYHLEQVSDVIFAEENAADAFALAREYGIRYLLVSLPLKPQPFAGIPPVFENDAVRIYEVQ